MKVYIGKYRKFLSIYSIVDKIMFWADEEKAYEVAEWLSENKDGSPSRMAKLVEKINNKFAHRKIKVRIDREDTWSMDNTLAYIILPMLKQLKESKHGSPYVDQKDLPPELRMTKREEKVFNEGSWNKNLKASEEEIETVSAKFHSQWDWVMDQMIWSFEQELDEENEHSHYYDPYLPDEEIDEIETEVVNEDGTVTKSKPLFSKEWRLKIGKFNKEKHKAYQDRKQLGFTLFGKYYQNLWD